VVAALGAPHCSPPARDTALSVIEALLQHQDDAAAVSESMETDGRQDGQQEAAEAAAAVLAPHGGALLTALRTVVLSATGGGSGGKVGTAPRLHMCED